MKELGNVFVGRESDQGQDMRPERSVHSDGPVFLSNGRHSIFSPMFRSPGLTTEAGLAESRASTHRYIRLFPPNRLRGFGWGLGRWARRPYPIRSSHIIIGS